MTSDDAGNTCTGRGESSKRPRQRDMVRLSTSEKELMSERAGAGRGVSGSLACRVAVLVLRVADVLEDEEGLPSEFCTDDELVESW